MSRRERWNRIGKIAFTYIGTMVGAGFATGQEILQFFTRYGTTAIIAILISSWLFIWLGTKMMTLAYDMGATHYAEVNELLFGRKMGAGFSVFMGVVLFGTTGVMLAGAGTIFHEHFGLPFQLGILLTAAASYVVIRSGIEGIMTVNAWIVPLMLLFGSLVSAAGIATAEKDIWPPSAFGDQASWRMWLSPLLYTSFNLTLAQSVLVPAGTAVRDRSVLRWAGFVGGAGIGLLLIGCHLALSGHMPDVMRMEIPTAYLIRSLGKPVQLFFLLVIYCEIFTTLIADAYGVVSQLSSRFRGRESVMLFAVLAAGCCLGQLGFSTLVKHLYPLFGAVSVSWLILIMLRRRAY